MDDVATCLECGAPLPCYGRGLSRRAMEALCYGDRAEATRRITEHVRAEVRAAGPEGITRYDLAARLGMDPTGESTTERLFVHREKAS
jgi:hypothetical protein